MHPGDIVSFLATITVNSQPTSLADGSIILGNLIALHEVGVEVVLAVELGIFGDSAVQSQSSHHRIFYRLFIDDGEDTRHAQANGADVGIGRSAGIVSTTPAEHLAPR